MPEFCVRLLWKAPYIDKIDKQSEENGDSQT